MGYRSDVHGIIYGSEEQVNALMVAAKMKNIWQRVECDSQPLIVIPIKYGENQYHSIQLIAESTKWYEGYDSVRAWRELVELTETFPTLMYEFIRIGEDLEDVERECSDDNYWLLHVSRSIATDFTDLLEG